MPETPNTYRCPTCDLNWPRYGEYKHCPGCSKPTWEINEPDVMNHAQADAEKARIQASRRKREAFEKFYAEREARRAKELEAIAHLDPEVVDQT